MSLPAKVGMGGRATMALYLTGNVVWNLWRIGIDDLVVLVICNQSVTMFIG